MLGGYQTSVNQIISNQNIKIKFLKLETNTQYSRKWFLQTGISSGI
jgi:hypothetical protein